MGWGVVSWQGLAAEPRYHGTADTCARVQRGLAAPLGPGSWELSVLTPRPVPQPPSRKQGAGQAWRLSAGSVTPADHQAGSW